MNDSSSSFYNRNLRKKLTQTRALIPNNKILHHKIKRMNTIEIFESDPLLKKIVKYFGKNTNTLAEILSSYTRVFGEKHEIISLLKDEKVQQYMKSQLFKEQSVSEFSKLVDKLGPQIIEKVQSDITIKDHDLGKWLKHVMDDEIK